MRLIVLGITLVKVLFLRREDCTPDEEEDKVPDKGDGDIVVGDQEGDSCEDDCSDEGHGADSLRKDLRVNERDRYISERDLTSFP